MRLLIDWGNTRLKWRYIDAGKRSEVEAIAWKDRPLDDLFGEEWGSLQPERVLVCSVLSLSIEEKLTTWVERVWGLPVEWLRSSAALLGVRNGYQNPQQLGNDRWAALLAARRFCRSDLCMISAGSALTMDCLTTDGQHLGGQIFPGLQGLRRALMNDVGLLTEQGKAVWLAKNTADGIVGGTLHGLASVVTVFVNQCEINLSVPVKVLMTGGDALLLDKVLGLEVVLLPDLILQGVECWVDR
ncbi:MAG: type III pantothenate kinase [Gammaproteobacteria bacterium]|nr:type III pantothenate kinase [Gammaproteobacteria bacterium]